MSQSTKFTNIPFPSETEDPWYGGFVSFTDDLDAKHSALLNTANNVIIPPPSVLWNSSMGQLTWSDDFIVPILSSGFSFKVRFGPDNATRSMLLADGDKVIITVPYTSSNDVVANFAVTSSKVAYQNGLYVFGMRYGTRFIANLPQVFT